jgi:protein tyrosine phosphatase (PTP) superfamily phosphohydrolase (DUF442 family)
MLLNFSYNHQINPIKNIKNKQASSILFSGVNFKQPYFPDAKKFNVAPGVFVYGAENTPLKNLFKIDDNFYRGAQPGLHAKIPPGTIYEGNSGIIDEELLKKSMIFLRDKCKVRTILDLRFPDDHLHRYRDAKLDHIELEKRAIQEINAKEPSKPQIKFINIPLDAGKGFNPEQTKQVMKTLKEPEGAIYAHCREGNDRTGFVTALYRIINYGDKVNFEDVRKEMVHCGHNPNGRFYGVIPSLVDCIKNTNEKELINFRHKM